MNDKQSRISVKHRELDIRRFALALPVSYTHLTLPTNREV